MQQDSPEQIEEEALAWLMRSTSGEFSRQQAQMLERWLAQSSAHRRAFEEAARLWRGLGELEGSPVFAEHRTGTPATPVRPKPPSPSERTPTQLPGRRQKAAAMRRLSFAAAACLALFALFLHPDPEILRLWLAEHHTAIGEQQALTLADGSRVYLNSASALDSAYDPRQRTIELIAGEAEFVVAKDPARPFVVTAGGHEIRALGTDFIVRKHSAGVTVTVIESAVQIAQPEHPAIAPVVLHPSERVDAAVGQPPGPLSTVRADRALAWRNNRLIFESETLDNVIAEINRYRPGHVFLSGRSLAKYRVSGVFNIDQIDNVLSVIDKTLPVKSLSLAGRFVLLY